MDSKRRIVILKTNSLVNDRLVPILVSVFKNPNNKMRLYNWLEALINNNHERSKSFFHKMQVSSFGYLMTIVHCLLKLYNILLSDVNQDKKIDVQFSRGKTANFLSKYDKISVSKQPNCNEGLDNNEICVNDVTKIWFYLHTLIHLALKNFQSEYMRITREIDRLHFEENLPYEDKRIKELVIQLICYDSVIKNEEFLQILCKLSTNSCKAMIGIVMPDLNLENDIGAQLLKKTSLKYSSLYDLGILPSFVLKNIITFIEFTRQIRPDFFISDQNSSKTLLVFSLVFLNSSDLINNVHLRTELFENIFNFLYVYDNEKFIVGCTLYIKIVISFNKRLAYDPFVKTKLFEALTNTFINAEKVGYYEKLSIRHRILYLMSYFFKTFGTDFISCFKEFALGNEDQMIAYLHYVVNDFTYLNDEALEKLSNINRYESLEANIEKFNSLDEETRKLEVDKYNDSKKRAKSVINLLNSSIEFLRCSSEFIPKLFLSQEKLTEKLANVLNYTLDNFTSSKCNNLKIKSKEKYNFQPGLIVKSLAEVYNNLCEFAQFCEYVVKDQRSFKLENFERIQVLKNKGVIDPLRYQKIVEVTKKLRDLSIKFSNQNQLYEDAPDEYLDPLTSTLMNDPVLLPSSKIIVDRQTIETHLLSSETDPFDRTKLVRDMILPVPMLKEKINTYKSSKINS